MAAAETRKPLHRPQVRHLRQVLLWPLRLMPLPEGTSARPWELLTPNWREEVDEYTGHADDFHERHYNEFVTFLPYVQRFLYGDGRAQRGASAAGSPMRLFRRRDVARVRVVSQPGDAPLMLDIVHVDLIFFFNIDLVLLNVEISADELPLAQAQDLLYRFGRAYPAGWDAQGQALHCMASVEFLDAAGQVLARSDAHDREAFLAHVAEHRAPRIAAHWAFMMEPLVSDHSGRPGALRFRQIEYHRMPTMAFLALDDPRALTRNDFVRLGLLTAAPEGRQRRLAALCRAAAGRVRGTPLLRPLLVRRRRCAQHALPVQRALAGGGGRRALGLLQLRRARRAGAVPPPALPAVPDRAFPEGGAADVQRPAGRGAEAPGHCRPGQHPPLQARHPRQLCRLPAASPTATGSTRCRSRRRRARCSA